MFSPLFFCWAALFLPSRGLLEIWIPLFIHCSSRSPVNRGWCSGWWANVQLCSFILEVSLHLSVIWRNKLQWQKHDTLIELISIIDDPVILKKCVVVTCHNSQVELTDIINQIWRSETPPRLVIDYSFDDGTKVAELRLKRRRWCH